MTHRDPRELIPETRPRAPLFPRKETQFAPINGMTQVVIPTGGLAVVRGDILFVLPTQVRTDVSGTIRIFEINIIQSDFTNIVTVKIDRRVDGILTNTIYRHETDGSTPTISIPVIVPIVVPHFGDPIEAFVPSIEIQLSAAGGLGSSAAVFVDWIFTESIEFP